MSCWTKTHTCQDNKVILVATNFSDFFRLTCLNFAIKDKEPIKTIDLEECQEVARDDSLGKGNCFR